MATDDEIPTETASEVEASHPSIEPTTKPLPVRDPDRYQIVAEHARGGIGRVLRATDREFGRDVALKELLAVTPTAELRFLREAIITSRLEHPNIVPVHEAGRWPDGRPYYAMKLVSGRPLRALVAEAKTFAERVALLGHVVAVADAMAYAHARGVIHRDLKPANIIVGEYGETIVIDWGLAKYIGEPEDDDEHGRAGPHRLAELDLTHAGAVLGTPAYMAPEQAAGGTVDERSDVYALGAILKNVLGGTLQRPEPSASPESSGEGEPSAGPRAAAARSGEKSAAPEAPDRSTFDREVPADLRAIVRRAMHVDPALRYESARSFGDDLRRWMAGTMVRAHVYGRRERATRWLAGHRRLVQGAAGVVGVLLVAAVFFLARETSLRRSEQRARETAESARVTADSARQDAETARDRADRTTMMLLEQQGRAELAAGRPFRAAAFLAEAYRRSPRSLQVRWLLTDALRGVDSLTTTFSAMPTTPGSEDNDRNTLTASFSSDDREIITGQWRSIGRFDARTGAARGFFRLPWLGIQAHQTSDGKTFTVVASEESGDRPARLIDPKDGHELMGIPLGSDAQWITWAADGRSLVSIDSAGRLDEWAIYPRPHKIYSLATGIAPIYGSASLSRDGRIVAIRGTSEVLLADTVARTLRHLPVTGLEVGMVFLSPDARLVLAELADHSVRYWEVSSGRLVGQLRQMEEMPPVLAFSADASVLVLAVAERLVFWDTASTIPLGSVDTTTNWSMSGSFSQRGLGFVRTNNRGDVSVWDLPRDRWARPLPGLEGHVRARYLATGDVLTFDEPSGSGRLRVWSPDSAEVKLTRAIPWDPRATPDVSLDGRLAAFVTPQGDVRIIETTRGETLTTIDAPGEQVNSVRFSADGNDIALAEESGHVRVYRSHDGQPGVTMVSNSPIDMASFSPDGTVVLTAWAAGKSRLWNRANGELIEKLAHSTASLALFSPDGKRFMTSGRSAYDSPKIWDSTTRQPLLELDFEGAVDGRYSRDGSLVGAVDDGGVVRIVDVTSGKVVRTLPGPTATRLIAEAGIATPNIDFSPDGKHLIAAGLGYALVWNIELDTRTPDQVDALLAARSPWQLVDGALKRRP